MDLVTLANAVEEIRNGAAGYMVQTHPPTVNGLVVILASTTLGGNAIPSEYTEFANVFSEEEAAKLPTHEAHDHAIETEGDQQPLWKLIYPLSATQLDVLRKYLDSSMEKGWIRRSTSPAGAPILFILKKDGSLCLCIDYRGLNAITKHNRHPLPLIRETLDRLGDAKIFMQLDLCDAYYRIRIK